jgi:hypothetical protein
LELSFLVKLFAWSAYLSAAATILTLVSGILFFTVGKPFGKINDICSIFQMLFMLPLAVLFLQLSLSGMQILGWILAFVGAAGVLLSGFGQTLLVLEKIDFEGSTKYFPAGAAVGVWLIGVCTIAITFGQLPLLLAWVGILAGAGYIATVIGFLWGGQQHPLFYIGGFVLGFDYPIWGIWLGNLLFSSALI